MADATGASIIGVFDFVVARFEARLTGLDDEEFRWEPVAGCWTVRDRGDGTWVMDGRDERSGNDGTDVEAVTTIAWRMAHLSGHVLGGFATWLLDGGAPYGRDEVVPHTAEGATAAFDRHWSRWREGMARLDPPGWDATIGPAFGPHRDASTTDLVLHVLDELAHHAAEVSLLRDLYRARPLRADAAP